MAYDEDLAKKVRKQLKDQLALTEKKMFGGLAFLINGNMSVGIYGNEVIIRIAPEATDAALKQPGVRIFDITGRPMKGWLLISPDQLSESKSLNHWIRRGIDYASSLPKK